MKKLHLGLGWSALGLVLLPPLAFWLGGLQNLDTVKGLMLAGTLLWFVCAPRIFPKGQD